MPSPPGLAYVPPPLPSHFVRLLSSSSNRFSLAVANGVATPRDLGRGGEGERGRGSCLKEGSEKGSDAGLTGRRGEGRFSPKECSQSLTLFHI